jgi:hypothetical protein
LGDGATDLLPMFDPSAKSQQGGEHPEPIPHDANFTPGNIRPIDWHLEQSRSGLVHLAKQFQIKPKTPFLEAIGNFSIEAVPENFATALGVMHRQPGERVGQGGVKPPNEMS